MSVGARAGGPGLAVVVAGALLLAACGGGGSEEAEIELAEEPAEQTTTTETQFVGEPWLDLDDPGPAPVFPLVLAAEPVGSVCLESATDGVIVTGELHVLGNALSLLGHEVVDDGCDAVVRIQATMTRSSAEYSGLGTCWTGYRLSEETTVSIGGAVIGSWSGESEQEPPQRIPERSCAAEDDPVFAGSISDVIVEQAVREMFGPIGQFAFAFQHSSGYRAGGSFFADVPIDDDVTRLLVSLLAREPDLAISTSPNTSSTGDAVWARVQDLTKYLVEARRTDELTTLRPLAPRLIALLECPDPCDLEPDEVERRTDAAQRALEALSGEQYETPVEWWSWWIRKA